MEQARFESPSPPSEQEQAEQRQAQYSLIKRVSATAALGLSVAALAVVGLRGVKDAFEDNTTPLSGGAQIGKENYAPIGEIDDTSPTVEDVKESMYSEYMSQGHTTGVLKPAASSRKVFRDYFSDPDSDKPSPTPRLSEVIYMQDQKLFKPEFKQYLYKYPFAMFNATENPVDLLFVNYAIKATKSWLAGQGDEEFTIGGHTTANVQPRRVPHVMIMTKSIPEYLRKELPRSDGVTSWRDPNLTLSFIKDSGSGNNPFIPWIIATEICQSIVEVDNAETVPGHRPEEKSMQDYIATFNAAAEDNLDLASQEEVCNALGRMVGAAYVGGQPDIDNLAANVSSAGMTHTPWLDYRPYKNQAAKFFHISKNLKNGNSTIITMRGEDSPTAQFYKQKEDN